MAQKVLLVTPPFTQLNTPYPATAYLKGFLNTRGVESYQADLGIEVILQLFSKKGLTDFFTRLGKLDLELSENAYRIYSLRNEYIQTIDAVIRFLQNKNPTLALSISDRNFLPEASRFNQLEDLDWAFGTMGTQDKARHLTTLYLEDLGDLITETLDPHFGFSRYAERLGRTTTHFDELHKEVEQEDSLVSEILKGLLQQKIEQWQPTLLCLSVPFPGNLFGAFKCAQFVKQNYPHIKVSLGGGYANTELRSLSDERVFDYLDFVCLDDGEATLLCLIEHLNGNRPVEELKRTYTCIGKQVVYCNGSRLADIAQKDTGTPDYSDLPLSEYISVIEVVNPMHRLWSDGRWNKLTLAHGCYWGKCSFCDISLDYIKNYEPLTAQLICDRMEELIAQTGQNGFHFVDEAAPPKLLREVALEILRRKLTVVWWTNIRFEKTFTHDLSLVLRASGCIAVSGGLEVASDRLLNMMNKGVTVAQVAQVADGFTRAGIMVHAYLMYGFPTQTEQETIDSLEMVRQLFEAGVVQSGFWHRFAMTSHSPVGLEPQKFEVEKVGPAFGGFADNDLFHEDPTGANHDLFAEGLRKSLFNYMHGVGFELALQDWFETKIPKTKVEANYIQHCLATEAENNFRPNNTVVWLGNVPELLLHEVSHKGKNVKVAELEFTDKKKNWSLTTTHQVGEWLAGVMPQLVVGEQATLSFANFKESFEQQTNQSFHALLNSPVWQQLRENGLLIL